MNTGARIRSRRKELGLTQEELAERVGLKKAAISKIEKGIVVNLKRDVIASLSAALSCSPSYLMGWDTDDPPAEQTPDPRTYELLQQFARLTDQQKDFILSAIRGLLSE